MPQSRHRHKHHTHQASYQQHHSSAVQTHSNNTKSNAALFFAIFIGLIGAIVAFFLYQMNWLSIVVGGIAGGVLGYLIGNYINKAAKVK